jgi:hypothetical protein
MFAGSTLLRGGEPVVVSGGRGLAWVGGAGLGEDGQGEDNSRNGITGVRLLRREPAARPGNAGRGKAWSGKVTRVPDCGGSTPPTRAAVRQCLAMPGAAMLGRARQGYPHTGRARFDSARAGCSMRGSDGRGAARQVMAGQGRVTHTMDCGGSTPPVWAVRGSVRQGYARLGSAWRGKVTRAWDRGGSTPPARAAARSGTAWQGQAWCGEGPSGRDLTTTR